MNKHPILTLIAIGLICKTIKEICAEPKPPKPPKPLKKYTITIDPEKGDVKVEKEDVATTKEETTEA